MNNQKNLIVMVITLSLILILSSSYALLRSTKVSGNNYSISIGDLKVNFQDSQTEKLNLANMYPMSDEEGESQEKTLTFTVENTGTVGTYYDVYIEELSTNPKFKDVIRFISNKDEEEYKEPKTLSENKYIEITGYLEPKQTSTYKVKVWLAEEADNTYMGKEFKAKIVVNAYQESNYAKDVIKSKLVKYEESSKEDFQGGLVAVNMDGGLYNETENNQTIREYRYSGPSVNNYVTFNDETWRILGVFKDENGEEIVKIVRNETLKYSDFPTKYTANETSFNIQSNVSSYNYAYWNSTPTGTNMNDWTTAGIMYWLNSLGTTDGYLKTLTSEVQNMIYKSTWHLGNYKYDEDTAITGYISERNASNVYSGNKASWTGKIALLYPSDIGFSTDSSNWKTKMKNFDSLIFNQTWFKEVHIDYEWLLSPSSYSTFYTAIWGSKFDIGSTWSNGYSGVRPTLYLKSNVKIIEGTGEQSNPYKLTCDNCN